MMSPPRMACFRSASQRKENHINETIKKPPLKTLEAFSRASSDLQSTGVEAVEFITSENSRHFPKPPLISPRNDLWETSAEIPY